MGCEQHGKGQEVGDKGMGSRIAGYQRRVVLTPLAPLLPPPPTDLFWNRLTKGKDNSQKDSQCFVFLQDLKFKLPKISNSGFRVFIRENQPWKLKQVLTKNNT